MHTSRRHAEHAVKLAGYIHRRAIRRALAHRYLLLAAGDARTCVSVLGEKLQKPKSSGLFFASLGFLLVAQPMRCGSGAQFSQSFFDQFEALAPNTKVKAFLSLRDVERGLYTRRRCALAI